MMNKSIMLHARKEDRKAAEEFYAAELKRTRFSEQEREEFLNSVLEVFDTICGADAEGGSLTLTWIPGEQGAGAQFMHAGPFFVPCPNEGESCPYTKAHMDETSYEFKYGRNAQFIFKLFDGEETKYRLL